MPARSSRPAKPTREQLLAVLPWIKETAQEWGIDKGLIDYVNDGLEAAFGRLLDTTKPKKPAARDLQAVQPWAVDKIVRWSRDQEHCDLVNDVLGKIFKAPARGYFVDSDGVDCGGYGPDGYNEAGFNCDGYDRNGFNERGFNKDGADRDGFDYRGRHVETGLTRSEWASQPKNLAKLIRGRGPEFLANVKAELAKVETSDAS